jgi:nicotinamide mononucleotide transporter
VTSYEIIGTILGLISVWLTVRQNIWCWPTGIVMVALYAVVFFQTGFYSQAGLQVVYVVLQVYGWYEWLHGGKARGKLEVTRIGLRLGVALAVMTAAVTTLMGYALAKQPDAALPYWDSAITVLSLVAQWMLTKKIIENWLVWIVVDVLTIGVCAAKALYPTMALYAAFLALAALGWIEWRKSLNSLSSESSLMPDRSLPQE